MNLETLKELYVNELRDLYNAENQLIKALPKMAKGASSDELKEAFEKHLEQTKGHVQRLEEVFQELGEKTKGKTCQAMKGLIEEGSEVLKARWRRFRHRRSHHRSSAEGRALRDRRLRECADVCATAWAGQIRRASATNFG